MPILRLAYIAVFLLALIAVFTLWSQVGGQNHLDLVPWSIKLVLGAVAAFAIARAAYSAVSHEHGWNGSSVKWVALALVTLFLCGMASYYAHNNLEDTGDEDEGDATISSAKAISGPPKGFPFRAAKVGERSFARSELQP